MSDLPPFDHETTPKFTEAPNASWTYGQRVETTAHGRDWMEGEKKGWKSLNTAEMEPAKIYQLMISGIVPRPVAFVSTVSETGVENLAPFSWFNTVTHNPPTISISCAYQPSLGVDKDTAANIKATKGFTVNIISEPWIEQANICSVDAPNTVSEWDLSGLTKEPSIHVKAARVKESAFSMECELLQVVDITNPSTDQIATSLVLGTVKYFHVREDMLNERGNVDILKLRPIARLGDISYARVGDPFRLTRPFWNTEGEKMQQCLASRKQ